MTKNISRVPLLIGSLITCVVSLLSPAFGQACSSATLNGTYAFTLSGWATPPPKTLTEGKSSIPEAAVGVIVFDGAGNWTVSFTISHNGDISSGTAIPGVYTVNADCTGSLAGAAEFNVVVINGGAEITGVQTDKNTTATLDAKLENASACSAANLGGNYSVTLAGWGTPPPHFSPGKPSVPVALGGLATFDGTGDFTGSFTSSHNGELSTFPADAGTYTVNSDCTGNLTDVTAGLNFATVLLNGGAEVLGIQTDNGTAAIVDIKKQ